MLQSTIFSTLTELDVPVPTPGVNLNSQSRHHVKSQLVHNCRHRDVQLWQPLQGVNVLYHSTNSSLRNPYKPAQTIHYKSNICTDYDSSANVKLWILSHMCTSCDLTSHHYDVTLNIPMTDTPEFWNKLNRHAETWAGRVSVGLMLVNTTASGRTATGIRAVLMERMRQYVKTAGSNICFHVMYHTVSAQRS